MGLAVRDSPTGFCSRHSYLSAGLTVWLFRRHLAGGGMWVLLGLMLRSTSQRAAWTLGIRVRWQLTGSCRYLVGGVDAWGAVGPLWGRGGEGGGHWVAHSLADGLEGIQGAAGKAASSSASASGVTGAHWRVHT